MALENAQYINQLVTANPRGADRVHQGDDHIRLIKGVLKATFPNLTGPITLNQDQINGAGAGHVPFGLISLWYGAEADVPVGWAICNGAVVPRSDGTGNVTLPDMRGRVALGASDTFEAGQPYGSAVDQTIETTVGGAHAHTGATGSSGAHTHGSGKTGNTALSQAQMPAHQHGNGVADDNTFGIMWRGTKALGPGSASQGLKNDGPVSVEGLTEIVGAGEAHNHDIAEDGAHTHPMTLELGGDHSHSISVSVLQPSMALHFIMKI